MAGTKKAHDPLCDRFIHSIRYLNHLLQFTGVDMVQRNLTKKSRIRPGLGTELCPK